MEDERPSVPDRLQALHAQLDALERRTEPTAPPPRPEKPPRMEISDGEKSARWWLFSIIQGWGAFIFILIVLQSPEPRPLFEWVLAAVFVFLISLGIYGMHLFYWELGKGAMRWVKRSFGSERSDG